MLLLLLLQSSITSYSHFNSTQKCLYRVIRFLCNGEAFVWIFFFFGFVLNSLLRERLFWINFRFSCLDKKHEWKWNWISLKCVKLRAKSLSAKKKNSFFYSRINHFLFHWIMFSLMHYELKFMFSVLKFRWIWKLNSSTIFFSHHNNIISVVQSIKIIKKLTNVSMKIR